MKLNLTYASHPGKTYFFQRLDGTIFPCDARQAFQLTNHRGKFTQVGVSDGSTYFKAVQELYKKIQSEADEVEKKLKYQEITQRQYDEELDRLQIELKKGTIAAQNAELEVARGNLEKIELRPINLTGQSGMMLQGADENRINQLLNGR
jgi:hypothetical protein